MSVLLKFYLKKVLARIKAPGIPKKKGIPGKNRRKGGA